MELRPSTSSLPKPILASEEIVQKFQALSAKTTEFANKDSEHERRVILSDVSQQSAALLGTEPQNGLRSMLQIIRGIEDTMPPPQRVNRNALLQASASKEAIDSSYNVYAVLPVIQQVSDDVSKSLREVLGSLNNYDPYINVKGILSRKVQLLEKYASGIESGREERFAVSAIQVMDIMKRQREVEGRPDGSKSHPNLAFDPYRKVCDALRGFLEQTNSSATLEKMGFKIEDNMDSFHAPDTHPEFPRVTMLSEQRGEHTFIVIHQVFETLFEDTLRILNELEDEGLSEQLLVSKIQEISCLMETASKFYPVLEGLLAKNAFEDMRSSFGIASGAQSRQYHTIERKIGLPYDDQFARIRHKQVSLIVGNKGEVEIATAAANPSLKERFKNVESYNLANSLRELNLCMLRYKIEHGKTMLIYLPADASGTAGTKITEYFASNMGPIFPVFTEEERQQLDVHRAKAIYRNQEQPSDGFYAIDQYVSSLPKTIPDGLLK